MSQNFVRIYRYPLIANQVNPLKCDLPSNISFGDAVHLALDYGAQNNRNPDLMYFDGSYYTFSNGYVVKMGGAHHKTPTCQYDIAAFI